VDVQPFFLVAKPIPKSNYLSLGIRPRTFPLISGHPTFSCRLNADFRKLMEMLTRKLMENLA